MEDYLPLFLTLKDPIAVYVIDNEIIGFEDFLEDKENPNIVYKSCPSFSGHCSPEASFEFLRLLYGNDSGKQVFPKELADHFELFMLKNS